MNIETKMKRIQSLQVGVEQLAMLALVILEKKPAVELDLYRWNTSVEETVALLTSIGLFFHDAGPEKGDNENHVASICISSNSSNALLLFELVKMREAPRFKKISDTYHIAYGALMGFPLTAIEGFITDSNFSHDKCPLKDEEPLQMFTLSKAHWEKEIEVIASWRKALEEHAPEILRKLDSVIVTREKI